MQHFKLRKLDATQSTNLELKNCLKNNNLNSGDVIWSLNQTDGRGQHKSIWYAEPNKHLAYSVFLCFKNLKFEWMYSINSATSLAVINTLSHFGVPNLTVKWPNDILSGNKKICGILIENQLNNKEIKSIIGIGINLFQESFNNKLPNATSILIETNKIVKLDDLLKQVSINLEKFLSFCSDSNVSKLHYLFHQKLYFWNKKIRFKINNKVVIAKVNKVLLNGLIELKFENGKINHYYPKQISMIY
tara:strand:- start:1733 stop:2470 length:738 start_codon:yes stop_codon:yes gene_type:complete